MPVTSPARNLVTVCQCPPIPDRRFDWLAYIDGDEESQRYGYGSTEEEAIADFIENWADEYEQADAERRERNAEAAHCGGLSPLGEALVVEEIRAIDCTTTKDWERWTDERREYEEPYAPIGGRY